MAKLDTPKHKESNSPAIGRLRRFGWSLLRIAYRTVGTACILSALVLLIAQTNIAQQWMQQQVLQIVNAQLQGKVTCESISLDVFRGLSLVEPRLYARGTLVLQAARLDIHYNVAALANNIVSVRSIVVHDPVINILKRASDSTWNIEHIVKPSPVEPSKDPVSLTILVRSLELRNARVVVYDSTSQPLPTTQFDATHRTVVNLWTTIHARYNLAENDGSCVIDNVVARDEQSPELRILALRFAARVSPRGIDVQGISLETPTTSLRATASWHGDIFTANLADALPKQPITGSVRAEKLHARDVMYAIPQLTGTGLYSLETDVAFGLHWFSAKNIRITTASSTLNGQVYLDHLDGKQPLFLDALVTNSSVRYQTVRQQLTFIPLPELQFLEMTRADTIQVRGVPNDSLWIRVKATDAPATFDGTVALLINAPTLGYTIQGTVNNANLAAITGDSTLKSLINGQVHMQGRGTKLDDLEGFVRVDVGESAISGKHIQSLQLRAQARRGATFFVDTLFADVTPKRSVASDPFERSQTVRIQGECTLNGHEQTRYRATITTRALNLASLTSVATMPSALSMHAEVMGRGLTLDEFQGELRARVQELVMRDRGMLPFSMLVSSTRDMSDSTKRVVSLESSFAHALIEGTFVPSTLVKVIESAVETTQAFATNVTEHITGRHESVDQFARNVVPGSVRVSGTILDASPLVMVLPNLAIDASLSFSASATINEESIEIVADTVVIQHVQVRGDSLLVSADSASLGAGFSIAHVHTDKPKLMWGHLALRSNQPITVNASEIQQPFVQVDIKHDTVNVKLSAVANNMKLRTSGTIQLLPSMIAADFDSVEFAFLDKKNLRWHTTQSLLLNVSNQVLNVAQAEFQRDEHERISASGLVSQQALTNVVVQVSNFNAQNLSAFIPIAPQSPLALVSGIVESATIQVQGTWKNPVIEAEAVVTSVGYNGQRIGALRAQLAHENALVTGNIVVRDSLDDLSQKKLDVAVRALPLDCGFVDVVDRLVPGRPIDIELEAIQLALAAVEPFLPAVEQVRGVANGSFGVQGTVPDNISLKGAVVYSNATFVASATNMMYKSDGRLHLDGSTLYIDTATVLNIATDKRDGRGLATGTVTFNGLEVESIDFSITTPPSGLQVMKKSSQSRSPNVYGDIVIASGNRNIRMHGPLNKPRLDGDVIVKYADMVLPKDRSSTKARYTTVEYRRVDSTKPLPLPTSMSQQQEVFDTSNLPTVMEQAIARVVKSSSQSFTDIMEYDLNIFLEGRTVLTMALGIFEILIADVELVDRGKPLHFSGAFGNNSTNLRGKVRVKEGASTYQFYKPFLASGTLDFSAGGIANPSLDLRAVYRDTRVVAENKPREDFRVEMKITGTKLRPMIAFRIFRNDREQTGDSAKITGDALMLILVGRTQDELLASGQGNLVSEVNQAFSAIATSALGDILSGIGGINASIDLGTDINNSRLTLSGQVFGQVSYRLSGQISDLSGNSTITVSVPFSVLSNTEALRYFTMDISRSINQTGNVTRQNREWEIRLGARLP
jgi:hypothetical protein